MGWTIEPKCGDTVPHDSHQITVTVSRHCNGATTCGIVTHGAHTVEVEERQWCPGVCDCGNTVYRARNHAPGEHK